MIYSKTCEYAIRALGYFVELERGAWATVAAVSQNTGVPRAYIAKIFQCLVQKNILISRRGVNGGYSLRTEPAKLRLIQVVRAMDNLEESPLSNCVMGLHECADRNPCPLHHIWAEAKELMLKELSSHTIADVAALVDKYDGQRRVRTTLSESMRGLFSALPREVRRRK